MAKGSGGTNSSSPERKYPKSIYRLRLDDNHLAQFNVNKRDIDEFAARQERILEQHGITVDNIRVESYGSRGIEYTVNFHNQYGSSFMQRTIKVDSYGNIAVENDYLKIPDAPSKTNATQQTAVRGRGTARALLGDQLKLWKKMGASRIDVHADISNGSYTWARFGFRMNRSDYDRFINKFRRNGLSEISRAMRNEQSYKDGDSYVNIRKITEMVGSDGVPFKDKMKPYMMHENWYGRINLKNKEDYGYYKKYTSVK